jgi:hypothetical protein
MSYENVEFEETEHFVDAPSNQEDFQEEVIEETPAAPENPDPGPYVRPKIEDFTTIEDYQSAEAAFQANPPLMPFGDDPHRQARTDGLEWLKKCSAEAAAAEIRGDRQAASDWNQRAELQARELGALPAPPEQEFMHAKEDSLYQGAVDALLGQGDPGPLNFDSPRVQSDVGICLVEANKRDGRRVVLPAENEAFGGLEPPKPGNCIEFDLDPQQYESFRDAVYYSGGDLDTDSVLRRSWDVLRQMGIDSHGQRPKRTQANPEVVGGRTVKSVSNAPDPIRPTGGSPAVNQDPETMSQRDYEKWRRKAG